MTKREGPMLFILVLGLLLFLSFPLIFTPTSILFLLLLSLPIHPIPALSRRQHLDIHRPYPTKGRTSCRAPGLHHGRISTTSGRNRARQSSRHETVVEHVVDGGGVKAYDHARKIVCAKSGKSMVDKGLRGKLGIVDRANKVNGFLVGEDVPYLEDLVSGWT